MKEKFYVDVVRIVLTILLVPLLFVFISSLMAKSTIYNPAYWRKTLLSTDVIDYLVDDIMNDEENESLFSDLDLDKKETKEMVSAYVDICLDEIFEVLIDGDTKMDRDRVDEFLDDYFIEPLEDQGMTDIEIEEEKQEFYDTMDESLSEIEDDLDEMGYYQGIDKAVRYLNISLIVEGIIIAAMCIVMIFMHQIKFRAIRNIGIAISVSQLGSAFIVTLAWITLVAGQKAVESDAEEVVIDLLTRNVGYFALIHVGLVVAGIIIAVICGNLTSQVKKRDEGFEPLEEI